MKACVVASPSRAARFLSLAPFLLIACGCGGGGGGADAPSSPPPPIETVPLAITTARAPDVVALSFSGGEGLLHFGEMAIEFAQRASTAAALSYSASCSNGGVLDALLIDADQSGKPSPGDTVRVTLRDCFLGSLEDIGVGEFSLVLDTPAAAARSAYSGELKFSPGFALVTQGGQDRLEVSGSLRVEWRLETLQTVLRVASTATDDLRLTAQIGSARKVERFHSIDSTKSLRYDLARSLVRLSFTHDSQTLGGRVEVRTSTDLGAFFNTFPDQGRVTLTGANRSLVAIEPHFVVGSERARIRADANGDGTDDGESAVAWQSLTAGYLWWEPISLPSGVQGGYATQPFNANAFDLLFITPPAFGGQLVSVFPEVVIQLTRELAPGTSLSYQFRGADSEGEHIVQGNVAVDGARISIVPREQLRHGTTYSVERSGGEFRDRFGNIINYGIIFQIETRNDLQAVAKSSLPYVVAAGPFDLDARDSSSSAGQVARYRWRQTSGTPAVIASPDSQVTSVTPALAPSSGELLVFELEIQNQDGEFDRQRVTVQSFQSLASGFFFHMRSSPGDYIGGGATRLFTSATGDFTANWTNLGGLSLFYNDRPLYQSMYWSLEFVAADSAPLTVASYEDAQRWPFQESGRPGLSMFGTGRGCNQVGGRFEIFELEHDANGVVTRLALDFEQRCEITGPPLFGSIRLNSTRPLTP